MNSKRVVFLLLALLVAGVTAFSARAWLQSERAAILAQARAGAPREVPVAATTLPHRSNRQARRHMLAVLAAGQSRTNIHTGGQAAAVRFRWRRSTWVNCGRRADYGTQIGATASDAHVNALA